MKAVSKWIIVLVFALSGCSQTKEMPVSRYLVWINDPENGFVKTKKTGGFIVKAKYLPKELLQLREEKGDTTNNKYYTNTMTFSVGVSIDKDLHAKYGSDILQTEVEDYNKYKARLYNANFNLNEKFVITVGNQKIHPVLCNLENTHGLTPGITFLCVFPKAFSEDDKKDITLTFQDDVFNTGTNHFVFYSNKIGFAPKPI